MDALHELQQLAANNNGQREKRPLSGYVMSQADLASADIPPRKFLLAKWLPLDSYGMVFAARGVGKSWFCMALAVAIAEGRQRFLSWEMHGQHNVLYIDGEMTTADLKERFSDLCREPLHNLFIMPSEKLFRDGTPICLDEPEEQKQFEKMLEEFEAAGNRPQVLIFDNLSTLRRNVSENDNDETRFLNDWFISLRSFGYSVIVVHHAGKSGQQRGASIIEVPMDYVIKLTRPDITKSRQSQGAVFDLELDKIRGLGPAADNLTLSLRPDGDGITKLFFETNDDAIEPHCKLLKYLAQKGRHTYRRMAQDLSMGTGTISGYMHKLMKDKLIEGDNKKPTISLSGRYLLYDFWPDEFGIPEENDLVHEEVLPF